MLNHFHSTPACNGQTGRQADGRILYSNIALCTSCTCCTGCASLNASSFVWPFLCSAVATRLHRTTWRETYSGQTRTTRGDDCDRRLRSATTQKLLVRRTRLRTIGVRAFGAVAPRVWNDMPADIVSAPSLAIFKRRLKTRLFGQSLG